METHWNCDEKPKECSLCGKDVDSPEYGQNYNEEYFCSKECLLKCVAEIHTKCDYCGKPFNGKVVFDAEGIYQYDPRFLEHDFVKGFYCSEDCLANAWRLSKEDK